MRRKSALSANGANARDRVIRAAIGKMLAQQYDLAEPLSDRLANLLRRFEAGDEIRQPLQLR
jgi:hypothetical protein